MINAKFDRIQKIEPHMNADSLEIATVSNYPCIVKKGEFSVGEWTFYIREDAKLLDYDAFSNWKKTQTNDLIDVSMSPCKFAWQAPLMRYLGHGGRVKMVKLRGLVSAGILLKLETVCPNIDNNFIDDFCKMQNEKILNTDTGELYLAQTFGIGHWVAPVQGASLGKTNARGSLVFGLTKTDEENFQNIDDNMFPWNEDVLLTKKLDGSSCSISSTPDGDVHVMSRSLDLVLDDDNVWNRAAKEVIPLVKELAKYYNEPIVVRGEVTGNGINASKTNLDCYGDPTFNMFGVVFPFANDYAKKIGLYGTEWHFLEINKKCKELTGHEIRTVPIEGVTKLTRELLENIANMPRSNGEGRVINTKSTNLPHFKSKSKDYLIHL